jgi:hypothetical protein
MNLMPSRTGLRQIHRFPFPEQPSKLRRLLSEFWLELVYTPEVGGRIARLCRPVVPLALMRWLQAAMLVVLEVSLTRSALEWLAVC